jgi:hypothetical protein
MTTLIDYFVLCIMGLEHSVVMNMINAAFTLNLITPEDQTLTMTVRRNATHTITLSKKVSDRPAFGLRFKPGVHHRLVFYYQET